MKSIDNQTFCACHAWQEKGASRVETFYGHRAEAVSDGIRVLLQAFTKLNTHYKGHQNATFPLNHADRLKRHSGALVPQGALRTTRAPQPTRAPCFTRAPPAPPRAPPTPPRAPSNTTRMPYNTTRMPYTTPDALQHHPDALQHHPDALQHHPGCPTTPPRMPRTTRMPSEPPKSALKPILTPSNTQDART